MRFGVHRAVLLLIVMAGAASVPVAGADNARLNDSVVTNVYTIHHQAGCAEKVMADPRLVLAAEWHAKDVLGHRELDGDLGSDGSTPQTRAQAAGFPGPVAQTVAINPAVATSGIEILNRWYYNPTDFAVMSDCANTAIGVWSENSPDRSVVVAVYGAAARGAA
ncbi:CAP domain-containing protein [[Mycobacterium] holstebronense]|uniref:CAP domain-containing protein n=1 Tax=[Mycobacterium] holstebronense TaxID=3064288 RepID=A0ABM9LP26_9MYCO|nr:CAP domain-containing protein [Mycolicibacter sp. MU0102]